MLTASQQLSGKDIISTARSGRTISKEQEEEYKKLLAERATDLGNGLYMVMDKDGSPFLAMELVNDTNIDRCRERLGDSRSILWNNLPLEKVEYAETKCLEHWQRAKFSNYGGKARESILSRSLPKRPGAWGEWVSNIHNEASREVLRKDKKREEALQRLTQKMVGEDPQKLTAFWRDAVKLDGEQFKNICQHVTDKQREILEKNLKQQIVASQQQKDQVDSKRSESLQNSLAMLHVAEIQQLQSQYKTDHLDVKKHADVIKTLDEKHEQELIGFLGKYDDLSQIHPEVKKALSPNPADLILKVGLAQFKAKAKKDEKQDPRDKLLKVMESLCGEDNSKFSALIAKIPDDISKEDLKYLENRYEANNLAKQILREGNKDKRERIIDEYLKSLKEIDPDKIKEMAEKDFGGDGNKEIREEIEKGIGRLRSQQTFSPLRRE
jgi:hypothetical protein